MKFEELFPDLTVGDPTPVRRRAWNGRAYITLAPDGPAIVIGNANSRCFNYLRYAFSFEDATADDWEHVEDG